MCISLYYLETHRTLHLIEQLQDTKSEKNTVYSLSLSYLLSLLDVIVFSLVGPSNKHHFQLARPEPGSRAKMVLDTYICRSLCLVSDSHHLVAHWRDEGALVLLHPAVNVDDLQASHVRLPLTLNRRVFCWCVGTRGRIHA